MVRAGKLGGGFRAMNEGGEFLVAFRQPADNVERLRAVGKCPFNSEGIQALAAVGAVGGAPGDGVGADRQRILNPAQLVNLVDVHFGEQAAGNPEEMNEIPNLPIQVLFIWRAAAQRRDRLHPIGTKEMDVAELAVADSLNQFLTIA